MNRRTFLHSTLLTSAAAFLPACSLTRGTEKPVGGRVMTVNGLIDAEAMGFTLTHEHAFADLRPYEEQVSSPLDLDQDEVVAVVLPYLQRIRSLGCRTFVDATATHLGRDPTLLQRLSEASGLHILTTTGNYAAADGRFVPPYLVRESSDELARRWIGEWERGIGGTDVRPGMVKIGVEGGPLTDVEAKMVRAAAATHLETGLIVGAHVGPWGEVEPGVNAASAFEQIALLEEAGVSPSAWIWIHAQNEEEVAQLVRAARRGAWVSLDGFRPDQVGRYRDLIARLRDEELLHRVLISQDAGWYSAGEPAGGAFSPFDPVFTSLIPALHEMGLTEREVDRLFVQNPAEAFSISVRRV